MRSRLSKTRLQPVLQVLAAFLVAFLLVAPLSAFAQDSEEDETSFTDGATASWSAFLRSSTSSDFYKDESMLTGSSTKTTTTYSHGTGGWSKSATEQASTVTTGTSKTTTTQTQSTNGVAKSSSQSKETTDKTNGRQALSVSTKVDLYTTGVKKSDAVWGVGDWSGSNFSVLGYEGLAYGSVSTDGKSVSATAGVSGKAWAVRAKLNETLASVGDSELGASLGIYVDARVGAEAGASTTAKVGLDGASLSANVNAFAGAKVDGWVPVTLSFCYLSAQGKAKGQLSAGIGGTATATVEIDWANLEIKLSAELAGTLGLGAGAGGEVRLSLGALITDPGQVADCILDKLKDLGEMALDAGEALVDIASSVIDEGVALVEAGIEVVDGAIDALASGVDRVSDAISGTVSSVASSLFGFVSSVIGGGDSTTAGSGCP